MERRLAANLAADVVGYTALMGADEAGTLRRLTELRQRVLEPLIAKHHGRVVKFMGDGLPDKGVTFKWKDYRAKGRERNKVMTLATDEFIRRFLSHMLPSGFHRIRLYQWRTRREPRPGA